VARPFSGIARVVLANDHDSGSPEFSRSAVDGEGSGIWTYSGRGTS
jgi:hypothetical protein